LACFDGLSSNTKKVDKVSNNQVEMNIKRLKKTGSCNECDLTGANLSGFSIGSVVQLRRAILNGADMSNGYFSHGRFYGAQLRNANLRNANLTDAGFNDVDLTGADLTGAKLDSITLDGAILCKTKMPWGVDNSGCR
jgi:uncharacterized protein YjbI with pentapeptide repeats